VDFEAFRAKLAAKLGVTALGNEVNRCRVVLNYASDQRLIPAPVHFGQSFDRPSKKARRRVRNESAPRMFTHDELLTILDALDGKPVDVNGEQEPVNLKADPQLKAMTLLGLNAGLGVTDCANLNEAHLRMESGWLDYPRVKTETPRRAPLWPETLEALNAVFLNRTLYRDPADAGIVFLTRTRRRWVRTKQGMTPEKNLHLNAISQAFGKLLHALNINGRAGLNFYTLRRQFEIVAGESRDQVAVDAIMGHVDESMAAVYRQNVVSDDRLHDVVNHVRQWLFGARENRIISARLG
jgi:integrase